MIRFFLLILALIVFPLTAKAVEAPAGQVRIDAGKVLRGHFVEDHQSAGTENPMHSSGHFIVAPANGLIWGIEKPFPTSTIISPNGAVQAVGGLVMRLPMKNIQHLYDTVGAALAGDWNGLNADFALTPGGDSHHWQMLLTPRPNGKAKLSYSTITVSGGRFVENIVMTKVDGSYDELNFTDEVLSPAPLSEKETASFNAIVP